MKSPISILFSLFFSVIAFSQKISITEEKKYIDVLVDSATYYYEAGDHSKSIELTIRLIKEAERIKDTFNIYQGYRYLGYDYLVINDTLLAQESFEKANSFALLKNDDTTLGTSYMDLGNLYGSFSNKYEKAKEYHDKSIEYFKNTGDSINLGNAYYNTALTLFEHKNYDEAYPYLLKADSNKYVLSHNLRIGIQNSWAQYYLILRDYEKVDYYLSEVFNDSLLQKSVFDLADSYKYQSQSYYAQKKYKKAFDASVRYQELYEKNIENLQNENSQKIAASFEVAEYKKDLERNELKNELQAIKIKNKERVNDVLIIIVIAFIIILAILLYAFNSRKKFVHNLKERNMAYFKAKQKSEELSKAKTEFFSTVSHELRTPLYGVIGLSTILLDDPKLKDYNQDLKSLKFSADYLLALINDVLQINKIDSNRLEENQEIFHIRDFIKNCVSSFEYMRLQNNNSIHIDIDNNIPQFVKGDATRLLQILMNLIGNALKFTENGIIDIVLSCNKIADSNVEINFIIKDTGIGIPEEKLSSIFDEFSQVSSKHYTYQGTGLGLPIVKKLLDLSNTEITVSSEVGSGSTFSFTLQLEVAEEIITTKTKLVTDKSILKSKHILIVDDNRINQIVTTKILQKSDVICSVANNGEEAVKMAKQNLYDLILMDINMPVLNGIEATKEIRKFNKDLPIIALTAVEVEEMRTKIFESGMTDIIVKPYDIAVFQRVVLRNVFPLSKSENLKPILK